jgi:hypothetical protein
MASATHDPGIPSPRLKLTQTEDTHGTAITEPAFGRVTNLRFDELRQTLIGDYEGVPAWLAEVLPAAYPNRSVEVIHGVTTPTGRCHNSVILAVQLLGVEWPGCTVLSDLPLYYTNEVPSDVTIKLGGGMGRVDASIAVEDIRREYYDELDETGNYSWWIQTILIDPNQLVVNDEMEGQLYTVDFTTDGDGNVTFGEPSPVKIQYVPDTSDDEDDMAAGGLVIKPKMVAASYRSPRESGRIIKASKGGEGMTEEQRKAAASKLGLPEDATEEQVSAKLLENALAELEKKDEPAPLIIAGVEIPAPGSVANDLAPTAGGAEQQKVAASANLTVTMDRAAHDALVNDAALGRQARLDQIKSLAATRVDEAVTDGRIAPASRASWMSAVFDERNCKLVDSELAVLAGLAKGRIPVDERGAGGGGSDDPTQLTASTGGEAYPSSWFPEVAARKATLAASKARGIRVASEVV